MTSAARVTAVADAARYVSRNNVRGAFVECGVWRGGSSMAAALAFLEVGDVRDLFLFDTFSGMTPPEDDDVDHEGVAAATHLERDAARSGVVWAVASELDVRANLASTSYPEDHVHLVVGAVEQSLPNQSPPEIAILRLDTDWYASTRHELEHLYPRLSPGGVLLIDDYGHWEGCRRAVDEYFDKLEFAPLLARTDYTGRLAIKP
jgi:O-methyltransferase